MEIKTEVITAVQLSRHEHIYIILIEYFTLRRVTGIYPVGIQLHKR